MSSNDSDIHRLYSEGRSREWLIDRLKSHPDEFERALETALRGEHPHGWRAAWILGHVLSRNDARLQGRLLELVEAIPGKPDGHQRELLRILLKLRIDDDSEGPLFDVCMTLWEDLSKPAAVRYFAIKHICRMVDKYPDLLNDLRLVVGPDYLEPLSAGIRKSVNKLIRKTGLTAEQ